MNKEDKATTIISGIVYLAGMVAFIVSIISKDNTFQYLILGWCMYNYARNINIEHKVNKLLEKKEGKNEKH